MFCIWLLYSFYFISIFKNKVNKPTTGERPNISGAIDIQSLQYFLFLRDPSWINAASMCAGHLRSTSTLFADHSSCLILLHALWYCPRFAAFFFTIFFSGSK